MTPSTIYQGWRRRAGTSKNAGRPELRTIRPRHPGRVQEFGLPQYRDRDRHRTVFFDAGEGDAIVFVHGLGGNLTQWHLVAPALARAHRVIGMDLPGFGATRRLRGRYTYDRLADEVFALMDRRGVRRAFLVGHSFGGAVATQMALRAPERLLGLVVVSPAGFFRYPSWMRLGSRVLFNPAVLASSLCLTAPFIQKLVCSSEGPGVDVFNRATWQPERGLRFLASSTFAAHSLRPELVERHYLDRLGEIAVPMHMVWGEADRLLRSAPGLRAMRQAPKGRLTTLPGVGHMPIFERPEAVIAAIRDVVDRSKQPDEIPTATAPGPRPFLDSEPVEPAWSGADFAALSLFGR
ncbi:MAG: alpha/beta fold hydrolase [bacterium]